VILGAGLLVSAGTALALASAMELGRPLAVVDAISPRSGLDDARRLIEEELADGERLNVAGPRESEAPGIYACSAELLASLLGGEV
jgi:hypothetical protein